MRSTSAGGDLDGLSNGELLEQAAALVAEQNRLAARLARVGRRAENRQACEHDGLASMSSWLTTHTRLSGGEVAAVLRQGRALERLPAVEAAYLAGQVSGDTVEVIAEIVRPENVDRAVAQRVDLGAVERTCSSSRSPRRTGTCAPPSAATSRGWIPTGGNRTPPRNAP